MQHVTSDIFFSLNESPYEKVGKSLRGTEQQKELVRPQ